MTLEVRSTPPGGKLSDFLGVVDRIYAAVPNYVRPLDMDMKDRLGPKNPFFGHGEAMLFTAHDETGPVGRISASIDRLHLEKFGDSTGFFGFVDTIDDQGVQNALLERATGWLAEHGIRRAIGPLSLCINEELGCLVDGFDTPPMLLMAHHAPYQGALIEGAGFTKLKDFYAWKYVVGDITARALRGHGQIAALPEVKARKLDPKHVDRDVRLVVDIFEDAWRDNWYAVPFTEAELVKMAADFKLILDPELTTYLEVDGEPAAFSIALPNLNEVIADLGGKLFPMGMAKLLWRLKVKGTKTARLALLGVKSKFRQQRKYAGLSAYMFVEMHRGGARRGIEWGELSWTVEDNSAVNAGIRMMGGKIYKRYRVYEKALV